MQENNIQLDISNEELMLLIDQLIKKDDFVKSSTWIDIYNKNILNKDFVEKYIDFIDFDSVLITANFPEDLVEKYIDKIDLNKIEKYNFSSNFLIKNQDKIDFSRYLGNKIDEDIIVDIIDIIKDNKDLYINQDLSDEMIIDNFDKLNIELLSSYAKLSNEFIENNIDKLNLKFLSYNDKVKLSEQFIEKNVDELDWTGITYNYELDDEFLNKYQDFIDYTILYQRQNELSQDAKKKYGSLYSLAEEHYNNEQIMSIKAIQNYNNTHEEKANVEYNAKMDAKLIQAAFAKELNRIYDRQTEEPKREPFNGDLKNDKIDEDILDEHSYEFNEENWSDISAFQTLSQTFMSKFKNFLDWAKITPNQRFTEHFAQAHADLIKWDELSKQNLSFGFVSKNMDKLNMEDVLLKNNYDINKLNRLDWSKLSITDNEKFIEKYQNFISVRNIDFNRVDITKLNNNFITLNIDEINFDKLSQSKFITPEYINNQSNEVKNRFNYAILYKNNQIDNDFIEKNKEFVDWHDFSRLNLSLETLEKFEDNINWHQVYLSNPSQDIINKYGDKLTEITNKRKALEPRMGEFSLEQIDVINEAFDYGVDATIFANKKYKSEQMNQIFIGITSGKNIDILLDERISARQMQALNYCISNNIELSSFEINYSVDRIREERVAAINNVDVYPPENKEDAILFDNGYSIGQIDAINNMKHLGLNYNFINAYDYSGAQLNEIAKLIQLNQQKKIDLSIINPRMSALDLQLYRLSTTRNHQISPEDIAKLSTQKKRALAEAMVKNINCKKYFDKNVFAKNIKNITNAKVVKNINLEQKFNKASKKTKEVFDKALDIINDFKNKAFETAQTGDIYFIRNADSEKEETVDKQEAVDDFPFGPSKRPVISEILASNINDLIYRLGNDLEKASINRSEMQTLLADADELETHLRNLLSNPKTCDLEYTKKIRDIERNINSRIIDLKVKYKEDINAGYEEQEDLYIPPRSQEQPEDIIDMDEIPEDVEEVEEVESEVMQITSLEEAKLSTCNYIVDASFILNSDEAFDDVLKDAQENDKKIIITPNTLRVMSDILSNDESGCADIFKERLSELKSSGTLEVDKSATGNNEVDSILGKLNENTCLLTLNYELQTVARQNNNNVVEIQDLCKEVEVEVEEEIPETHNVDKMEEFLTSSSDDLIKSKMLDKVLSNKNSLSNKYMDYVDFLSEKANKILNLENTDVKMITSKNLQVHGFKDDKEYTYIFDFKDFNNQDSCSLVLGTIKDGQDISYIFDVDEQTADFVNLLNMYDYNCQAISAIAAQAQILQEFNNITNNAYEDVNIEEVVTTKSDKGKEVVDAAFVRLSNKDGMLGLSKNNEMINRFNLNPIQEDKFKQYCAYLTPLLYSYYNSITERGLYSCCFTNEIKKEEPDISDLSSGSLDDKIKQAQDTSIDFKLKIEDAILTSKSILNTSEQEYNECIQIDEDKQLIINGTKVENYDDKYGLQSDVDIYVELVSKYGTDTLYTETVQDNGTKIRTGSIDEAVRRCIDEINGIDNIQIDKLNISQDR